MHRPSPGDHGRSEVRERPALVRSLRLEQRRLSGRMLALRQGRELTQEVAAAGIGISRKQLLRVELGQANVTLATLLACARFYKVELREMFAEQDVSGTKHHARTLSQEQARLSERVRGLRSARGLTQEEAAERIGLSVIQYGRLERAQANISLATLVAVAVAFRVKLGELFGE